MSEETTEIRSTGLRYVSKSSGSPYMGQRLGASLSCFHCGRHKPRAEGRFRRLIGKMQFECFGCRLERQLTSESTASATTTQEKP